MLEAEEVKLLTRKSNYQQTTITFIDVQSFNQTSRDFFEITWIDESKSVHKSSVLVKDHSGFEMRFVCHSVNDYKVVVAFEISCGVGEVEIEDDILILEEKSADDGKK